MDLQKKLQERLATEKTFEDSETALLYATTITKEKGEDVAVFKREDGIYVIIHLNNTEIAIQSGYSVVFSSFEVAYASQASKNADEAINEIRNLRE